MNPTNSNTNTHTTTPVGRIVWGNPTKPVQRKDEHNQLKVKSDGTPDIIYSFGLAISKAEFQALVWPKMAAEAMAIYPNGAPSDFAYKYIDGDGPDKKGQSYARREGYAGSYILSIESIFPIRIVESINGVFSDRKDPIKTGDYVRACVDIKGHGTKPGVRMSKAGLYVNPIMVQFVGYGQEIVRGPSAEDAFGTAPVALPFGASSVPTVAPSGMPGPLDAPAPAPVGMPNMQTAYHSNGSVLPAHDFVQNATGMPGMPGMPR